MNTPQNDGGPAFPTKGTLHGAPYQSDGMSLRDWFAGMAIQALLAGNKKVGGDYCQKAYMVADRMLWVRDQENESP